MGENLTYEISIIMSHVYGPHSKERTTQTADLPSVTTQLIFR